MVIEYYPTCRIKGNLMFVQIANNRSSLVAVDGRIKLVLLALALGINLMAGGLRVPFCLAVIAASLVVYAGIRPAVLLKRMVVPVMLAMVVLFSQMLWVRSGTIYLELPIASWQWTIYTDGLQRGLELALRILGGMSSLLCFSLTTPLPELMRAARFFRCPVLLVELTMIIYRYLFLLLEEGQRIRNAQVARLGYAGFRSGLASSGILGGMLLLRTYDRAERNMVAMRSRGYQGVLPGLASAPIAGRDWLALAIGATLLLALYLSR